MVEVCTSERASACDGENHLRWLSPLTLLPGRRRLAGSVRAVRRDLNPVQTNRVSEKARRTAWAVSDSRSHAGDLLDRGGAADDLLAQLPVREPLRERMRERVVPELVPRLRRAADELGGGCELLADDEERGWAP